MKKNTIIITIILFIIFSNGVYAQTQYDNQISMNVGDKRLINVKYPEEKPQTIQKELRLIKNGKNERETIVSFIVENDNIAITKLSNNIYGFKALKKGKTEIIFNISFGGDFVGNNYPGYETSVLIEIDNETNNLITNVDQLKQFKEFKKQNK